MNLETFPWDRFISITGSEHVLDHDDPDVERLPPLSDDWKPISDPHPSNTNVDFDTGLQPHKSSFDDSPDEGAPFSPTPSEDHSSNFSPNPDSSTSSPQVDAHSPHSPQSDTKPNYRRSNRVRQLNKKYFIDDYANLSEYDEYASHTSFSLSSATNHLKTKFTGFDNDNLFVQQLDWMDSFHSLACTATSSFSSSLFHLMSLYQDNVTRQLDTFLPFDFKSKAADADSPTYEEATHGINSDGFWNAMFSEILGLLKKEAWEQVPVDPFMSVLSSTWVFRVKRYPDGLVQKLKARIWVRGDQQPDMSKEYEDPFYAPVVSWSTVRLLLILSVILNLHKVQIDFTLAFTQASVHEDIFVHLPRGWRRLNDLGLPEPFQEGHVLRLRKSLYGLRQSPKNFFDHLKDHLLTHGFSQSHNDRCMFVNDQVVCLVYDDDCLLFSLNKDALDSCLKTMKTSKLDFNIEDGVAGFLGVHLDTDLDGAVHMKHTNRIN